MNTLPVRLPPGADLRQSLETLPLPGEWGGAFVVAGIGSLSTARVRFAGADDATALHGDLEILTLSGSLTADGAHLHISVADGRGAVFGGHLGHGSTVRTTAELLLVGVVDRQLSRAVDPRTGFAELVVGPRPPPMSMPGGLQALPSSAGRPQGTGRPR